MHRHQFETYLDKVFDFSDLVDALPEGRRYPQHPWKKIFEAVFLGAACQFGNVHRIETECRCGALAKRIGSLSEDTIGYSLERQDPEPVFTLGCEIARRLKRNGVLQSDWARGRVVAAVDGIEICSSFVRCCPACLERKVKHKVHGVEREDVQYYHRLVAVVVVSTPFPIPLGLRFLEAGENELAPALALIRALQGQLGPRYFDLLVADALYLTTPFVKAIEALGLDWVINLKENQPELLAQAEQGTSGAPDDQPSAKAEDLRLWHAPHVYWPVADRHIRIVKTIRVLRKKETQVERQPGKPARKTRQEVAEESLNFYASNLELGLIPPLFVHQLGRSRWTIDSEVFQTLTTDCHLKRPSVHQDHGRALVVLTMIRVLAYTLALVFYYRQVRSHGRTHVLGFGEMARQWRYEFFAMKIDTS